MNRFDNDRLDRLVKDMLNKVNKANQNATYAAVGPAIGIEAKALKAKEALTPEFNALVAETQVWIKKLRDETGASIILMHHIGKGMQAKKVYSARGASARAASVDVVLNLIAITEDTVCLQKEKDRIAGGKEKLYLRKVGEDNFDVVEQGEEQEVPLIIRAQYLILELLEKGLQHRFEFNEQGRVAGYSEATIGRALDSLVRVGKAIRVKKGIYTKVNNPIREDPRVVVLEINHLLQPYKDDSEQLINPSDSDLTDEEKHNLVSQWLKRGSPSVMLGNAQWADLNILLHGTDPYLVSKRTEYTPALRHILDKWKVNDDSARQD